MRSASLFALCSTVLLCINQASNAQVAASTGNQCGCAWRDAKTGEPVGSGPLITVNPFPGRGEPYYRGVLPNASDPDTAFDQETGRNFVRDANCIWHDAKTGEPVGSGPFITVNSFPGRGEPYYRGILPDAAETNSAFDAETGRNFIKDSCPQKTGVTPYEEMPKPSQPTPRLSQPNPPAPPAMNKSVSMSGFTPAFQLRGFGGPSFINGNTPATAGGDGAVLFPLGNHILVGPTGGFQWINSSLVQTVGSKQPGSTFINTAAGFKSGNFGAQIQIPFMFFHPTGVHIDIHAGATVANSTITQAEGFCGLGNATSPAGCNVTSTTTTHDTVIGPFLGGYISHSIFPHVGVFAGYDWIHLKDTTSGGSTTGSSSRSQTLFDLNQKEIKLGIEIRIPITTHPPVLVSPTSTSPR